LPHSSAPPIAGWHIEFSSITQPLRSIPFPGLHRYYELFRPWAPLPYSHPRGSSTCGFSVRIGVPGSHVPLNRLLRKLRPPECRMPLRSVNRHRRSSSRVNDTPAVSTSSLRFRHVISGSLAVLFLPVT
jgi:hypothetical protein